MKKLLILWLALIVFAVLVVSCTPSTELQGDAGEPQQAEQSRGALAGNAKAVGGVCVASADCNQFLACVNGKCMECANNDLNCLGKICRRRVPDHKTATELIPAAERSFATADDPLYRCTTPLADGNPCERNSHCQSNNCLNGRCVVQPTTQAQPATQPSAPSASSLREIRPKTLMGRTNFGSKEMDGKGDVNFPVARPTTGNILKHVLTLWGEPNFASDYTCAKNYRFQKLNDNFCKFDAGNNNFKTIGRYVHADMPVSHPKVAHVWSIEVDVEKIPNLGSGDVGFHILYTTSSDLTYEQGWNWGTFCTLAANQNLMTCTAQLDDKDVAGVMVARANSDGTKPPIFAKDIRVKYT